MSNLISQKFQKRWIIFQAKFQIRVENDATCAQIQMIQMVIGKQVIASTDILLNAVHVDLLFAENTPYYFA